MRVSVSAVSCLVTAMMLTGCAPELPEQPRPRYPDAAGRRVVLRASDGEVLLKWRRARGRLKVYDASLRVLATVQVREASGDHPASLEWRGVGRARQEALAIDEGGTPIGPSLRLALLPQERALAFTEETGARTLAKLRCAKDGEATLSPAPGAPDTWRAHTARRASGQVLVSREAQQVATALGPLSPEEALVVAPPGLSPLERGRLAMLITRWCHHARH